MSPRSPFGDFGVALFAESLMEKRRRFLPKPVGEAHEPPLRASMQPLAQAPSKRHEAWAGSGRGIAG